MPHLPGLGCLILTMVIPAVARTVAEAVPACAASSRAAAGWRFLRGEPVLRPTPCRRLSPAPIGVTTDHGHLRGRALSSNDRRWGARSIEMAIDRQPHRRLRHRLIACGSRGQLVIIGYVACGAWVAALALTEPGRGAGPDDGDGRREHAFVIPTQALFMERTPNDMIGRVISFRFSAVFGSMTIAMAVGGS
jgi:hypothetical protein